MDPAATRLETPEAEPADRAYNLILDGGHTNDANGQDIGEPEIGRGNVNRDTGSATHMTVAAGTAPADPGTTENDAPAKADTPEKPNDDEAEAPGSEFSGSPQPAGPDLTATQEKDLISSGWK